MPINLTIFKSKIHRAHVTDANLDYEGSVTISGELMQAAHIYDYEQVHIWNVTRGTRLVTYAIRGEDHSGVICINGAGAHLMKQGDIVILATFANVQKGEMTQFQPTVVFVDQNNKIAKLNNQELNEQLDEVLEA